MKTLGSSERGLDIEEVQNRQKTYGENALPKKEGDPAYLVLLRQLKNPLMVILSIAAILSGVLGEWIDFGVIAAAVLVNALIGFFQEYKASQALEKLHSLVQPHAIVRRGGKEVQVEAKEVVPGDILVLAAGDRIVADVRLLSTVDFITDEAALTGESLPIEKDRSELMVGTSLAERKNMGYAGTTVAAGRAVGVVVATGVNTELGKIARLVEETEEKSTPLQAELKRLARWLATGIVVAIVVIFFIGIFSGYELLEMFETAVALAVAAIPEGLVIMMTVVLAIGMQKMLKRKALVRRLIAGETLGSVSLICTDKTGTITEGVMAVSQVVPPSGPVSIESIEKNTAARDLLHILEVAMLCNDASVSEERGTEKTQVQGSPTERALMIAGLQIGVSSQKLQEQHPRVDEIPFDSSKKYMATLNAWGSDERAILFKGAPERVLERSGRVAGEDREKRLVPKTREKLNAIAAQMAEQGLRVLAVAYKPVSKSQSSVEEDDLDDFIFLGFIGLQDPLRKEAKDQIALALSAGVRTVLVTGDHPSTARAIGAQVGLISSENGVVTGDQLDEWDDDTLKQRVPDISIYARVEPRHKIRIVDAWQARGEVVAMTGDGVNDAPALKSADIGIALGSGTEVAKEASDIVLLDNNLSTITAAIEQGRVIFDNIRKSSVYLLVSSFTELILIGGALLFRLPLPLLPTQILWINLIQDTLPSIALTAEPGEPDIMKRPPRPRREPVLNKEMLFYIFFIGLITDIAIFFLFIWYLNTTGDVLRARTIVFTAVSIDSLLYVFAIRNFRRSIFRANPFSNLWLVGAVAAGFGFVALSRVVPFFVQIFEITPLSLSDWGLLLMMGMMKLVMVEVTKEIFIFRNRKNGSA